MLCLQWCVIPLRHSAASFLDNLFWRPSCLSPIATRTTHLWVTTSFQSLNSKHNFCYIYSEVYPAQTTSHFNSAYLFWRPLFLSPKSTGLPTTGNMPNACSTLLYLFSFSLWWPAQRLTLNSSFIKHRIKNLTASLFFPSISLPKYRGIT